MKIDSIKLFHIRLPINETYHLSFGDIDYYDTVIAEITAGGEVRHGESTPLFGYSHEHIGSVIENVMEWAGLIKGSTVPGAMSAIAPLIAENPFAATSLVTALESFQPGWERPLRHERIDLVGIVSSDDLVEVERRMFDQIADGFKVVKLKVGSASGMVARDIEKVRFMHALAPGVPLRVDANKGYDFAKAREFVKGVQDCNIELFEQPFQTDEWLSQKELFSLRDKVPLMLDEAINTMEDLELAISMECCDYVKFKLMKHGSFTRTQELIDRALSSNLKVIVGNGVQTEWACMQEARLLAAMDEPLAGENNGFLKQTSSILMTPIEFRDGAMKLEDVSLSMDRVAAIAVNTYEYR